LLEGLPALALDELTDWLAVSVPVEGLVLGVAEVVPCDADWSVGLVVAFWLLAAPGCDVAPWGAALAELDGLAVFELDWFAAPVGPAAPGFELFLQVSATCWTELTVSEFPLDEAGFCEPELGAAEPEVPDAEELLVVPVICTSWPTCCCSLLVSPVRV
jgi:hypothetical protein